MNKKAFVGLFLTLFLVLPSVSASPQIEKFDVKFDIVVGATEKNLTITIHNLQDSADHLDLNTLINSTDFPVSNIINAELYVYKTNLEREVPVIDYGWAIHSRTYNNLTEFNSTHLKDTYFDEGNQTTIETFILRSSLDSWNLTSENGYWYEYEEVGSHLETEIYGDFVPQNLVSKTEDGVKGEVRHKFEQMSIQKKGQSKDMVILQFLFATPIIQKADGSWGNEGIVYLEMNGETYVDKENSSDFNVSFEKKRIITVTNNNATVILESGSHISSFQADVSGANNGTYIITHFNGVNDVEIDAVNNTQDLQTNTNISFTTQANITGGGTDNNYTFYYENNTEITPLSDECNVNPLWFTCFTEVDVSNDIEIPNRTHIIVTDMGRDVNSFVYKKLNQSSPNVTEFKAKGSFELSEAGATNKLAFLVGYADGLANFKAVQEAVTLAINEGGADTLNLDSVEGGAPQGGDVSSTLNVNTQYWWEFTGVGLNLKFIIYSDSSRTAVVDTLINTRSSVETFEYFYVLTGYDDAQANTLSFKVFELEEATGVGVPLVSPSPSTSLGAEQTNNPPSVIITSPTNTTVGGPVFVNATIEDDFDALDTALVEISNSSGSQNFTLTNSSGDHNAQLNLGNGEQSARIWANDTAGNVNGTEIVFFTVSTINLTVVNPRNITHINTVLPLTLLIENVSEIDSIFYNLNEVGDVFITSNTTITAIDGSNNITVSVNLTSSAQISETIFFSAIEDPITIFSPLNTTTTNQNPLFNASFNLTVNASWLNINSTVNQSFSFGVSNLTVQLSGFPDGQHNITVYINDSGGVENSEIIFFIVDTTLPIITFLSPTPNDGSSIGSFRLFRVRANMTSISGSIQPPVLRIEKSTGELFGVWNMDFENTSANDLTGEIEIELPSGNFRYLVQADSSSGVTLNSSVRTLTVTSGNINIDFISPSPDDDGIVYRKRGLTVSGLVSLVSGSVNSATLNFVDIDGVNIIPPISMNLIEKTDGDWIVVVSITPSITKSITATEGFMFITATDDVTTKTSIMRRVKFLDPDFDISCLLTTSGRDCGNVGGFSISGGLGWLDWTFPGVDGRSIISIFFLVALLIVLMGVEAGNLVSGIIIGSIAMLLSVNGWLPQWIWILEVLMLSGMFLKFIFDLID